jgi:proteasome-associated ATPase
MSDHRNPDQPEAGGPQSPPREASASPDPIELIEECLAAFPDGDPRQKLLYKLRHVLTAQSVAQDRRDTELKKLNEVVAKLTAPANRVGLLLGGAG